MSDNFDTNFWNAAGDASQFGGRGAHNYQQNFSGGYGGSYGGPARDYYSSNFNQSSGYYQQPQPSRARGGGGPHRGFNPNAMSFTPGGGYGRQQAHHFQSNYGGSGAYGYNDAHHYYQNQNPMQWRPEWNDPGDDEAAAYDNMYSLPEQQSRYVPTVPLQQKIFSNQCVGILQEIQVGLEQLITEPDDFEIWASAIKDRFVDRSISADAQRVAVELLIEMVRVLFPYQLLLQAVMVSQQGVQYSFARLLATLSRAVSSLLADAILPTLRSFHETRSNLTPDQLTNLLLFSAECYDKLETKGGQSVDMLRIALADQIDSLLKPDAVSDTIMKNVIQVIKLTGRYFDRNAEGREDMDGVLMKVNAFAKGHPQLSESIKSQVQYLNELRASNWGFRERIEVQAAPASSSASSGLYIGPDGNPLSDEERKFLEEHFGQLDMGDPNEQSESFDEADAAQEYENFLRQEQNNKVDQVQTGLEKLSVRPGEKEEETSVEKPETTEE